MPSPDTTTEAAKRRACDECRSRKLACSKEADGCSRCIRDGIECHYSEQKPMGRPRKRRCNGETKESTVDVNSYYPEVEALPFFDDNFPTDSYFESIPQPFIHGGEHIDSSMRSLKDDNIYNKGSDGSLVWRFGADNFNRPINFGMHDSSPMPEDPILQAPPIPSYNIVEASPNHHSQNPPCSCLATIYLAMSSLQDFPTEITAALTTVRTASIAAQTVLRCQTCGICSVYDLHPSIEVFQNVMLLGTIFPTIVNGYKRLLAMVDCEANMAKAAGVKKVFRLKEYGGIGSNDGLCDNLEHVEKAEMDPIEWRAAIRSLLRADIYGHENVIPGLKGIITEMEQRQRDRHSEVDKLRAAGTLVMVDGRECDGQKGALCLRILETAKTAIDALVIA